jgi:hypothetical protein
MFFKFTKLPKISIIPNQLQHNMLEIELLANLARQRDIQFRTNVFEVCGSGSRDGMKYPRKPDKSLLLRPTPIR